MDSAGMLLSMSMVNLDVAFRVAKYFDPGS